MCNKKQKNAESRQEESCDPRSQNQAAGIVILQMRPPSFEMTYFPFQQAAAHPNSRKASQIHQDLLHDDKKSYHLATKVDLFILWRSLQCTEDSSFFKQDLKWKPQSTCHQRYFEFLVFVEVINTYSSQLKNLNGFKRLCGWTKNRLTRTQSCWKSPLNLLPAMTTWYGRRWRRHVQARIWI